MFRTHTPLSGLKETMLGRASAVWHRPRWQGVLIALLCLGAVTPARAQEVITNDAIVQLSSAGVEPAVIVSTIETSRTRFSIGVQDIVALSNAKVNASVIAAMQAAVARGGQPKDGGAASAVTFALPTEYGFFVADADKSLPLPTGTIKTGTDRRGKPYLQFSNNALGSGRPVLSATPTFVVFTPTPPTAGFKLFHLEGNLDGTANLNEEIVLRQGPVPSDNRMQRLIPNQPLSRGTYAIFATDNPTVGYTFARVEGTPNPPRLEADLAAARARAAAELPLNVPMQPEATRAFVRQVLNRAQLGVAKDFGPEGLLVTRRDVKRWGFLGTRAAVQFAILVQPASSGGSAIYVAADAYTSGLPSGGLDAAEIDRTPIVASPGQSRSQMQNLLKELQKAQRQR